ERPAVAAELRYFRFLERRDSEVAGSRRLARRRGGDERIGQTVSAGEHDLLGDDSIHIVERHRPDPGSVPAFLTSFRLWCGGEVTVVTGYVAPQEVFSLR